MERFNGGIALEAKVVDKISKYFEYRWANHKNIAISR